MSDFCLLALLALLIEAAIGYPDRLWRLIGHPVSWIGRIIDIADRRINLPALSPEARQWRGGLLLGTLLLLVVVVSGTIHAALFPTAIGYGVLALIASALVAQRSLHAHVAAVADALERDLASAREAVGEIVGRDTGTLDASGVARAAIESLAENFSDGVVAPAIWMAVAGLPGAALYKTINTADSMIGHRTVLHEDFGKASAILDDVVNWPPARLAAGLLIAAAALKRGASMRDAWRITGRDAAKHRSPNAGWPEAAMAGALNLQLSGPRDYHGVRTQDTVIGDGWHKPGADDIRAALALYRRAAMLLWLLLAIVAVLLV